MKFRDVAAGDETLELSLLVNTRRIDGVSDVPERHVIKGVGYTERQVLKSYGTRRVDAILT
jgi:hypothetical protein